MLFLGCAAVLVALPVFAAPPDLTGVWTTADGAGNRTSFGAPVPQLPLRAEPKQRFDAWNNLVAETGDTPGGVCLGSGMPAAMLGAGGYPFEIIQRPEQVTIIYELHGETRRVYFGDRNAPEQDRVPGRTGYSIGRWEGNTLVVDTLGYNGLAELDARGQPTSPKLHTIERITPTADGSSIDIETTVEDPEYYTRPFPIKRSWKKSPARHPFEYDCMENPRQEDFENAYYIREQYKPVCMRVEGEGMAPSKMVCKREP